jgi:hypothetical protein
MRVSVQEASSAHCLHLIGLSQITGTAGTAYDLFCMAQWHGVIWAVVTSSNVPSVTTVLASIPVFVFCLPADALDKCLSVLKPTGHYSHIQNLGTDPAVMQRLRQQHQAGKGPGLSHIFVTPNGAQLGQVLQLMADGKLKLEVAKVGVVNG